MKTPTAFNVDQNAVNLIHDFFNELLKPITLENEFYEQQSKTPTAGNNDRRYDSKRTTVRAGKHKGPR